MNKRLSGLSLEYQILEIYSRDAGQRSAKISLNVGQGSQDIGFRNDVTIVFNALPARTVTFRVKDENGQRLRQGRSTGVTRVADCQSNLVFRILELLEDNPGVLSE